MESVRLGMARFRLPTPRAGSVEGAGGVGWAGHFDGSEADTQTRTGRRSGCGRDEGGACAPPSSDYLSRMSGR